MLAGCAVILVAPCRAAKKAKTQLYRNVAWGFCAEMPADWNGPGEVASRPGGRFGSPDGYASVTFALGPDRPRSVVLLRKDAGTEMATLDHFREAIPNTWKSDSTVSDVKVVREESATLNGAPALDIELAYKRTGMARRYEIVFALSNNEEWAVEYDATKRSGKRYEKDFREAVSSFEFHCAAAK
jgi:hypothetical protein